MRRSEPAPDPTRDSALATLTGVRSGKRSYYVELVRSEERMTSAVEALEGISSALVRSRDDPRALLGEVLRAAAGHLASDWTAIALRTVALPAMPIRLLAVGPNGELVDDETALPAWLQAELAAARTAVDDRDRHAITPGLERVPVELDGRVLGRLVSRHSPLQTVDHADRWVLSILANQAAVSMHTATLYTTAAKLRGRAQQLLDEVGRSSQDLRVRTEELRQAEDALQVLHDRELLDAERHRIALELHDSVAQHVLSAGLAVDLCRAEAVDGDDPGAADRLTQARDLIGQAGEQVRSVIYALHHEPHRDTVDGLTGLLEGLAAQHRGTLDVTVRVEGRPVPLGPEVEHALARTAGEALFNVSIHAGASRAIVRLQYRPDRTSLLVSDDGGGDPAELRRRLRLAQRGDADGRHQGVAGMSRRARDLGGTFVIRRSKLGGVRIEVRVPTATTADRPVADSPATTAETAETAETATAPESPSQRRTP